MVYAIFGIPLVLAILNDLGSLFCKYIVRLWRRIQLAQDSLRKNYHSIREFIRHRGKKPKSTKSFESRYMNDGMLEHDIEANASRTAPATSSNSVTDSEDEFKQVPVTLALAITFSWIFFCASLFLIWEKDWSYFQVNYLCIVNRNIKYINKHCSC